MANADMRSRCFICIWASTMADTLDRPTWHPYKNVWGLQGSLSDNQYMAIRRSQNVVEVQIKQMMTKAKEHRKANKQFKGK